MRKTLLAFTGFILAVLLHTGSVQAQSYPWCAQYGGNLGGQNCGFSTLQQCRATVSGTGGYCFKNPMAQVNRSRRGNRQQFW